MTCKNLFMRHEDIIPPACPGSSPGVSSQLDVPGKLRGVQEAFEFDARTTSAESFLTWRSSGSTLSSFPVTMRSWVWTLSTSGWCVGWTKWVCQRGNRRLLCSSAVFDKPSSVAPALGHRALCFPSQCPSGKAHWCRTQPPHQVKTRATDTQGGLCRLLPRSASVGGPPRGILGDLLAVEMSYTHTYTHTHTSDTLVIDTLEHELFDPLTDAHTIQTAGSEELSRLLSVWMYMDIWIYMHIYGYMNIYGYLWYMFMCINIYIYMCIYLNVWVYICVYRI